MQNASKPEAPFDIPFVLEGVSPAVKNNLGAIQMVLSTLKVKCKVNDLLPHINVNVNKLEKPGQQVVSPKANCNCAARTNPVLRHCSREHTLRLAHRGACADGRGQGRAASPAGCRRRAARGRRRS